MRIETIVTKELLFSYFSGNIMPLQRQTVEHWIRDTQNHETYYQWLDIWEKENLQYAADVDKAILSFREFIANPRSAVQPPAINRSTIQRHLLYRWRVAASLLFLIAGAVFLFRNEIGYKTYRTGYGRIDSFQLYDGSRVILNAHSSLRVARFHFGEEERKVFLKGEANFSVVHTYDHKKFVVETDSMFRVEVLGTEFSVKARPNQTKIVLLSGQVKVHYGKEDHVLKTLIMKPGELVSVNKQTAGIDLRKVVKPENFTAWKHNRFVFDNTSLADIKNMIEENYGLKVEMSDSLSQRTVSGSFKAETVNEFLRSVSEVLNLSVNRQNDRVELFE